MILVFYENRILLHELVKRKKRETQQTLEVGYKVKVEPFNNDFSNKTFTEIAEETTKIFENDTFENFGLTGEKETKSRMKSEIEKQSSTANRDELLCGIGYSLTNSTCISKCFLFKCENDGQCIIDKYGKALCRCSQTGDFIFSGPKCEIQTEKLALGSTYIIAITTTVGVILSIVIMITCFLYYLKRRTVKSMTKDMASVDDVEDISQYRPSSMRRSFYTSADMYSSVYKSSDNEFAHQKEFDNSRDQGNKVRFIL
ncbi:MEP1B [Mytilus coruscus]|uniref:MEP1B n=1 Tax=Mytilus coruscus TaxID=42192 RepID=A0A6J8B9S7_MYTCO|nr:MEP1B [Mytilus coruscus]